MNRRDIFKLIVGGVATSRLALAGRLRAESKPEPVRLDGWRSPHDLRAGDFVYLGSMPIGVALADARAGEYVQIQTHGPAMVRVRS